MHAEYVGASGTPLITLLECVINGSDIELTLEPESRLARLYGADDSPTERTECNYGLRPDLFDVANGSGMRVVAVDSTGECRAVELTDHPFFIATLYLPQLTSIPGQPHPIFSGFVAAVAR